MKATTSPEARTQIVNLVRDFVKRDVEPVASGYDNADIYPQELVEKMAEMGLFRITIPEEYGGLGVGYTTFAMIFEELSKGWMGPDRADRHPSRDELYHRQLRHQGAEARVPAQDGTGRGEGRARPDGARSWQRRSEHPDHSR